MSKEEGVPTREGAQELCLPSLSSEAVCAGDLGDDRVLILIIKPWVGGLLNHACPPGQLVIDGARGDCPELF